MEQRREQHTVLSNMAIIIAEALDTYGCDGRDAVEQVGIDYDYALNPDTRITFEQAQQLWRIAIEKSGDPCFGLVVAEGFNPALLHGLGFSWMASGSLKDALGRMVQFQRLINTGSDYQGELIGNRYRILPKLVSPDMVYHPGYTICALAGLVRLCRLTAGNQVNPELVTFVAQEPECSIKIREYFQSEVQFKSELDAIYFDVELINQPIKSANSKLAKVNDQVVIEYLSRYDQNGLITQVQAKIIDLLPSGLPNQEVIAREFNLSLRNFQRKLKEQGTSYRELTETLRKDLAMEYMSSSNKSIGQISFLLGFTEPANFARSFRRWTGYSPKNYQMKFRRQA